MPTASPEVRASSWSDTDYQNRFAELRSDLASLRQKDRESTDYRSGMQALQNEVDDLDQEFRIVRLQLTREQAQRSGGAAMLDVSGPHEVRSWGDQVVADENFRAWMGRNAGANSIERSPSVELRTLVTEATGSASGSNFLLPVGQPFLGNVNRQRLFIRDLLSVGQTGLSAIPYVRELNAVANQVSASTVAEGAVKPEAAVQFTGALAPTTVIAANIPITTQILEDAPTVVSYINGRLVYMLKLREEAEILTGNGVSPDLTGIRNFSGLQTQSATAGQFAQTLGNAIAKIELVNGYPSGIAMNPQDAWAMMINRAAGGSGTFDAGIPFSGDVAHTVWGLPIVKTISMPQGKALVGDFALGAQLFDRKQATVNVYEQHSNFAVLNQVLVQAEERLALAVYRPDWFCEATLA